MADGILDGCVNLLLHRAFFCPTCCHCLSPNPQAKHHAWSPESKTQGPYSNAGPGFCRVQDSAHVALPAIGRLLKFQWLVSWGGWTCFGRNSSALPKCGPVRLLHSRRNPRYAARVAVDLERPCGGGPGVDARRGELGRLLLALHGWLSLRMRGRRQYSVRLQGRWLKDQCGGNRILPRQA